MTEREAITKLKRRAYRTTCYGNKVLEHEENLVAIQALEKQEKIKEAFEMWKAETGGYYGADDETTRFISTLSQILRSDEE